MTSVTAPSYTQSRVFMDTAVTIEVCDETADRADLEAATRRSFGWFEEVEQRCSRFDEASELRQLCSRPGVAVCVSPLLFRAIEFAVEVAAASGGAFDPTVGGAMEQLGYNHNYRSGQQTTTSGIENPSQGYRSLELDRQKGTVRLNRPLLLDLGAVAKGLAIDLAANELLGFAGFAVNAGGDLRVGGSRGDGQPWRIGIRHPRRDGELLTLLKLTEGAVCTSGDYERPTADGSGHHLLTPDTGRPVETVASVTVVAPTALLADASSTAAFALGPKRGLRFLKDAGIEGLIVTPALETFRTAGLKELPL